MEINLLKSILGRAVLLHGVVALSDMASKCVLPVLWNQSGSRGVWRLEQPCEKDAPSS